MSFMSSLSFMQGLTAGVLCVPHISLSVVCSFSCVSSRLSLVIAGLSEGRRKPFFFSSSLFFWEWSVSSVIGFACGKELAHMWVPMCSDSFRFQIEINMKSMCSCIPRIFTIFKVFCRGFISIFQSFIFSYLITSVFSVLRLLLISRCFTANILKYYNSKTIIIIILILLSVLI